MCILLSGRLEKTIVRNPSSPAIVIGVRHYFQHKASWHVTTGPSQCMSHEAKLHQVASVVTQAAVAEDAPSIRNITPGSGLLGVMELRSHSCRCSEDSSLLMLSRTAFFTLVDMTGQSCCHIVFS